MTAMSDFNRNLIEEFRTTGGSVTGAFAGRPLLLLTTTGAKTGRKHTTPVVYLRDDDRPDDRPDRDRVVVFGSKGGSPSHPAWFHNLVAHPDVTVELPGETFEARALVTEGAERERLWATQKERMPAFAEYETKTDRQIPVIVLERI